MELLPCPFCGEKLIGLNQEPVGFSAICSGCDAEGPFRETELEAAKAWNVRPFDPKYLTGRVTIDKDAIKGSLSDKDAFVELTKKVINAAALIGTKP